MVNLLKQHPQNYLLKKYFDEQEYPGDNIFEYITVNKKFVQMDESETSIFEGNVHIKGDLYLDQSLESMLEKIQSRYLTIYEPNEIEQVTDSNTDDQYFTIADETPQGVVDSQNQTFTLQNTDVKEESVSIFVDSSVTQITDDGQGNLSDGGTITYQTGVFILNQQPQTSVVQNYQYQDNWTLGGGNTDFILTKTPIKEYSVFISVDIGESGETLITDDGLGVLSDGGTIDYDTGEISLITQPVFTLSVRYVHYIEYHTEDVEGLFNDVPTQGFIFNRGSDSSWDKKMLWDEKPQNLGTNYFSFVQNDETTPEYVYFKFDQNSPLFPEFDSLFLSNNTDDTMDASLTINNDLTVLGDTNISGDLNVETNVYLNNYSGQYSVSIVDGDVDVQNNITIGGNITQGFIDVDEIEVDELTIGDTLDVQNLHVTETIILDGPITTNKILEGDIFDVYHNLQHFYHDVQIDGDLIVSGDLTLPDDYVLNTGDIVTGQLTLNKGISDSYQVDVADLSRFTETQEFNKGTSTYQIDCKDESIFYADVKVDGSQVDQDQGFVQGDSSDSIMYNLTLNNNLEVSGTITTHDDILPDSNLLHDIGSDTLRINTVYQDVFDGNITNQVFQDIQENIYQSEELEFGDICELSDGKIKKQMNGEQKKLFVISENPQVHLQTDRENSYPIQLQGSVYVKLNDDRVKLGDEIVLDTNGVGKIRTTDDDNLYILGQVIEIKDNGKIKILLY